MHGTTITGISTLGLHLSLAAQDSISYSLAAILSGARSANRDASKGTAVVEGGRDQSRGKQSTATHSSMRCAVAGSLALCWNRKSL